MKSLTTRLVAILVAAGMALAWMTVARAIGNCAERNAGASVSEPAR